MYEMIATGRSICREREAAIRKYKRGRMVSRTVLFVCIPLLQTMLVVSGLNTNSTMVQFLNVVFFIVNFENSRRCNRQIKAFNDAIHAYAKANAAFPRTIARDVINRKYMMAHSAAIVGHNERSQ